jgi:hypothetical protein
MSAGLLRRIGLILVAVAFLSGGMPRMAMFDFALAPAAMNLHAEHTHVAHTAAHHDGDCGAPAKKAPGCHHPDDCLACVALAVPVGVRLVAALHWTHLAYHVSAPRLSGVTTPPELFPPIRQS